VAQQVELRISDAFNNNHHGNSDTESFVSTTTDVGQQNLSRLPSLASEKFLKDLLQDFVIRIGCQKCMNSKSSVTDASCEQNEEECSRDRLLAATNTSGNWHPVRCIVLDYLNDICLCQPQRQQCVGETCVHAHNSVELQIWRRARQACLALEEFFLDVTHSKLLPELILRFLTSRKLCELAMLCRECVRQENYDSALKAKHRPKCQGGHQWNDCAGLCYAINDARGQGKVAHFIGDRVAQPALSGKQELVAICINEVKRFGLTDEDILSLATTTEYHKPRDAESKRPRASSKWAVDSLEQFTGDTLDNESQSLSQLDESIDDNGDGDNDIYGMQDMEEEPYYKLIPAEEARKKTLGYSDKYRHCRVKLDGLQSASAVPVQGDSQIILLSGRSNCGPCFDGDEVIVKLKPNSDQHASKESSTSDPSTRRGTVVAIVKKVQRRKGSVFICTVDEHSSSLMRPLCGTVPKIHVMNGAARDKFGDERVNNYVALYKRGDNGHIQPTSVIALNEKKRQDKLFVVCIEKWDHNYMYPLGFAMCYIPEGTDEASSQRIINLACHVPARYQPGDLANFQPDLSTWAAQLQCHREDLRSEFIISIDPPECTDVDDALSVKVDKDNQKYTVSVHIADVSFFVAKDSKLDNEACRRGLTYYPVGKQKPIHMLPGEFVEHYCSLLPHRDRPCITVTFVVDQEGNVEEPHVSRTLISNKRKLTYSEAQELITSYADNKNFGKHIEGESSGVLRTTLMHLNLAAQLLRRKRLGNSRHHVLVDKLLNLATHQDTAAHILVEELMITANSIVAERIIKKFPHCTPLRRQSSPEKEELEKWFKQYAHYSSLVSSIEQHAPYHLDSAVSDEQIDEPKVSLLAEVAEMLREATQSEDIAKIREILRAEQYHPLQALALDGWLSIQHSAEYVSSGCCEDFSHFALNKQHYTHFTSPIRRYIDIIIHRLLVSTLESTEQCPYTNDDMREICSRANKTKSQEKKFEKYSTILATAASLSSAPVFMPGILVEIDESGLCFQFPGLPHMKRGQRSVTFSKLDVSEKPYHPVIGEDQTREFIYDMEQMILKWNRRIYDVNCFSKVESAKPQSDTNVLKLVEITSDRHVRNVSLQHYQSVRKALKNSNNSQLLEAVRLMLLAVEWNPTCPEILSETKSGKIVKHHTEGRLQLHAGVVMHVQLGAECQQGFLQPRIMQVSLTPEYCMCVQHMDDAVKCFSNVATKKLEDRYKSLSQYQDIWRPIISMEAAYSAIQETDPVVIKNVPVRLRRVSDTNRPKYCGQLELDIQFCMERCINLSYNVKDGDEDMLDYLCLKFALTPRRYDHTIVQANTWTCHALGDRNAASDLDDSSCTSCSAAGQHFSLKFVVHHSSTPPPSELLDHPGVTCTVELLAKPLPHRYETKQHTCMFYWSSF
jgi:VacB/RNase II family 3'-5' exoribonuclease